MAFATKSGALSGPTPSSVTETTVYDYAKWSSQKITRVEALVDQFEDLYGRLVGTGESKASDDAVADYPYGVTTLLNVNENRFGEQIVRLENVFLKLQSIIG